MASTLSSLTVKLLGDPTSFTKMLSTSKSDTMKWAKDMRPLFLGITGLVTGLGAVGIKAASDLNESINAVQVVFGDASKDVLAFGQNSAAAVGLSTNAFNELAATTGALLKQAGVPVSQLAGQTTDLTTRAADLASVFNTDVSDAMNAIASAIRGETEPIRRYAADVTDASLQQYALSKGITTSVSSMSNQEKMLLRTQLLMQQTAFATGDFANTSDGLANGLRIVKADLTNAAAEMGTYLLPVMRTVVAHIRDAVEWFGGLSDGTKKTIIVVAALAGGLAALGLVIPPIVAAVSALAAIVGVLASPVVLVIAAVGALAIAWSKNLGGMRDFTRSVVDKIGEFFESMVNGAISAINFLIDKVNKLPGVSIDAIDKVNFEWGKNFDDVTAKMDTLVVDGIAKMKELAGKGIDAFGNFAFGAGQATDQVSDSVKGLAADANTASASIADSFKAIGSASETTTAAINAQTNAVHGLADAQKELAGPGSQFGAGPNPLGALSAIFSGVGTNAFGGKLGTALENAGVNTSAITSQVSAVARNQGISTERAAQKFVDKLEINFNGVNPNDPQEVAQAVADAVNKALGSSASSDEATRNY